MSQPGGQLLVVDFDFFFPVPPSDTEQYGLFEWAHAESEFFIQPGIWYSRASSFCLQGLPLPQVNDEWEDWWPRFNIAPDAPLFISESNCTVLNSQVGPVDGIWLFDAHHDAGYSRERAAQAVRTGRWTCEDWMYYYGTLIGADRLHMRYPRHRPGAFTEEPAPQLEGLDRKFYDPDEQTPRFDKVFVCHSGAWVPPWCDPQFKQFVQRAGRPARALPPPPAEREWDPDQLETFSGALRQVLVDAAVRPRPPAVAKR